MWSICKRCLDGTNIHQTVGFVLAQHRIWLDIKA